jgi:hypothetical protein
MVAWSLCMVKLIRQSNTGSLAGMAIGIHGNCDAGMPELLRDVLDGGMVLVELDRRVTVPQIMNAIAA